MRSVMNRSTLNRPVRNNADDNDDDEDESITAASIKQQLHGRDETNSD